MRALVTGACGFVGQYLARHLVANGDQVLGTVMTADVSALSYETTVLDVADSNACSRVISEFKPDVIYHLAGIAFVPEAEDNFQRALAVNVGAVNNIFRVCHLLELGTKILLVSSAEVYGRVNSSDLPLTEKTACKPTNNYSLSKLMAEQVAERYSQFGKVEAIIARPFNHVGPGQNNRFVVATFAEQLARIAHGKAEAVLRVGNLEARRDFTDVRDMVRAYHLAATRGQGVYTFASGTPVSIEHILLSLIKISGVKVHIEADEGRMRPSERPLLYGSAEKAYRELGWRTEITLEQTLQDTYRYWYDLNGS